MLGQRLAQDGVVVKHAGDEGDAGILSASDNMHVMCEGTDVLVSVITALLTAPPEQSQNIRCSYRRCKNLCLS